DYRIDVSLQQQGLAEVEHSVERLVELLRNNGGRLPLNDRSRPEEVAAMTQMSKKVFKRAVGMLMKRGEIVQTETGIESIKR
ncbi:MAG: hypothetical protein K2J31_07220, partial [Alistipes sp.]|nr:hypothetical protein [Alistipes sp.]